MDESCCARLTSDATSGAAAMLTSVSEEPDAQPACGTQIWPIRCSLSEGGRNDLSKRHSWRAARVGVGSRLFFLVKPSNDLVRSPTPRA
jgi:hypothetical protein